MNFIKSLLSSGFSSVFSSVYAYLGVAVAVVVAGLGFTTYYYKSAYEQNLKEVASMSSQLAQATQALNDVNKHVDALKAESDLRMKASADALAKAQKDFQTFQKNANTILVYKPVSSDACVAAKELYNLYLTTPAQK
jgi:hypothetical protein